ncbi:MAG TPA: enoyl-CoA hydratase-related protein [Gammaproteobacteria bacterium]|nr:enoyl-CoA hydratase-related protein [Gammaproteobacteria bacterium]
MRDVNNSNNTILVSKENHLVTLTFNRPDKLNAFNHAMADQLAELCQEISEDQNIRVVVMQGAGEAFMSGTDLYEVYRDLDVIAAEALPIIRQFNSCILALREMDKIVIASVHGMVMGIGMSLMLAADLVIAAENTKFSLGYNRVGLSPMGASSYLLPRIVGAKKALEMLVIPEVFDADHARAHGLVNWVCKQNEMNAQVEKVVEQLVRGPMVALNQTKQLLNSAWQNKLTGQLELEAESLVRCVGTKDFKIAVRAFVNKKPAEFEGR